jgi:outer membrane protein
VKPYKFVLGFCLALFMSGHAFAQHGAAALPSAPLPVVTPWQLSVTVAAAGSAAQQSGANSTQQPSAAPSQQASPAPGSQQPSSHPAQVQGPELKLGLHDAEQLAMRNHPRITIAQLSALASKEAARQVRAAFFPIIGVNATGVTTYRDGNRITAGALNNPSVFDRAGSGLTASQLITDFGRTSNLNSAADLHAQAQQQNAVATREQVVFTVDQTFYDALSADVLVKVAEQTVQSRQVLVNQVEALEKAKLRSALDLSFANVSLAQAQLLLVNSRNNRDAAYANLVEALGLPSQQPFELVDVTAPQPLPGQIDEVIQEALSNRPDLKALELEQNSAEHLLTAEERLQLPDISALGTTGITPVASERLGTNAYGAVGVNVHIPVFNGFLFSARANEARYRAKAASERVRDLRDTVAREVRVAWLNANSAFERESVATKLLEEATLSLNLAQARYNLGLSSIVELSQAQLQQTEAEISTVTAKYQYEFAVSALSYQTGTNAP